MSKDLFDSILEEEHSNTFNFEGIFSQVFSNSQKQSDSQMIEENNGIMVLNKELIQLHDTKETEKNKIPTDHHSHKSKRIKKDNIKKLDEDYVVDSAITRRQKYQKKKKETNGPLKKQQYPTKNFLQNFKGGHMTYLRSHLSSNEIDKYPITQLLSRTNNMNMKNYVELYSISEFRPIFEKMFNQNYLYRHMMLSRSEMPAKINHSKKIIVLEKAFRKKEFKNIN